METAEKICKRFHSYLLSGEYTGKITSITGEKLDPVQHRLRQVRTTVCKNGKRHNSHSLSEHAGSIQTVKYI